MPTHNPEDRVRVKNIVSTTEDDHQTFYLARLRKIPFLDANGNMRDKEVPYDQEISWNFKDGFFFLWGGRAYMLKPNEVKSYPRFLANQCAKEQVQYLINKQHAASKRVTSDGITLYGTNILNNKTLKDQIKRQVFIGVESYYEQDDSDFDSVVNKQFGGNAEEFMRESVDPEDYELPTEEQEIPVPIKTEVTPKATTSNLDLQKLRDECDANTIEWSENDTIVMLKNRIKDMMG